MGTEVTYMHSAMAGAPVLNGTAGSMIALLDAFLKDGIGLKTVDSLVVSGGVATATVSTGHSAEKDCVVLIAGATPAALNGERRVLGTTANTVTFDATGVADQTATGTISLKLAPLGWVKPFSGTNLAVYKSADVMSTGMYLRVDDGGTLNARVTGYESMSDAATGVGPFPTSSQLGGGGYWLKSYQATATARAWFAVGDARSFYLCVAPGSQGGNFTVHWFGDIVSLKSGDAYSCVLACNAADRTALTTALTECLGYSAKGAANAYIARAANALGGAQGVIHVGAMHIGNADSYSGYGSYSPLGYPNNADNGLIFCRPLAQVGGGLRGVFPGLYHVPQPVMDSVSSGDKVTATGDLSGRVMRALRVGSPGQSEAGNYGAVFFDIAGPWR